MRCDECKTDPLTPGHFCECCGRKLSLQERRALEGTEAPPLPFAPDAEGRDQTSSVDRLVGVHFAAAASADAVAPTPTTAAAGPGFLDPILEAHFAGQVPVDPAPAPAAASADGAPAPVAAAPVAPPVVKPATPRVSSTSDWVEPAANVSPVVAVDLFTDTPPVDVPSSHGDSDVAFPRCEVCGAHAEDGDLCATCRETFHALLEPPPAAAPVEPAQPVEAQAKEEMSVSPAPPTETVAAVAAAAVAPTAGVVEGTLTPLSVPVGVQAAAPAAVAPATPPIQIKFRPPVAPSSATQPAPTPVEAAPSRPQVPPSAASMAAPARVTSPTAPQAQPASNAQKGAAIVAVVVALAAIGIPISKMWLGHQETPAIVQEQPEPAVAPAAPAPAPAPAPERNSLPSTAAPEPVVVARAETVVPTTSKAQPVVPASPKPAAVTRPAAAVKPPVKTVRQPVAPPRPVAAAPVSSPAAVAPAPEVAPPVVAAPEPKPEAPAAPIGPFFELRDVNEVPRVLSRVDPQVPDDLRDRQLNEVVIVRVLVTQAGHPMMVNILRRSKAGASLDEAIVDAVKKWTFAPARRKGEAVSCWYHVGVPVS